MKDNNKQILGSLDGLIAQIGEKFTTLDQKQKELSEITAELRKQAFPTAQKNVTFNGVYCTLSIYDSKLVITFPDATSATNSYDNFGLVDGKLSFKDKLKAWFA